MTDRGQHEHSEQDDTGATRAAMLPPRADLVVLGSGPAGIAAAAAYRAAGGRGDVLVLSADVDEPYERPPLTKESLRDEASIAPSPIAAAKELAGVDLRLGERATSVDLEARTVTLGDRSVGFERLIVATGSIPKRLPNVEDESVVHTLRSLEDARRLDEAARHARTALVIGSGFIGSEAAASLARRGLEVTLATREDGIQRERLGDRAAAEIASWLRELGVEIVTGVEIGSVEATRDVHLSNGRTLRPDLILAALGVEQSGGLLEGTGLQLFEGRVVVDERMRADDDGLVHAAGDVARAQHAVAGRALSVEHWGDAETMGEIAGRDAARPDAGDDEASTWTTPPGFWSVIGDRELKLAGWGDGFDELAEVDRPGGFAVYYGRGGELAGVLAVNADADYEHAMEHLGRVSFADAVHGRWPEDPSDAHDAEDPAP